MDKVVRDNFLCQHVKKPTHFRGEQPPTLIYLVFSSDEDMISNLEEKAPLGRCHHQILTFDLKFDPKDENTEKEGKYIYSKGNYDKLRDEIKQQNLAHKLINMNAKEAWNCLANTCDNAVGNHIPKTGSIKGKKRNPPPLWMNEKALKKGKKKKHAEFARYMDTREGREYQIYAKARNQARDACKQALKEYERKIAKNSKVNPKAFYAYVNSRMKSKTGIADLIDEDGNRATSNIEKAEVLNKFYCSVFTKENMEEIPICAIKETSSNLSEIQITKETVLNKTETN